MRNFSLDLPVSRSQVHLTSLAVKGLPSCHLTPWRSGKVSSLPSSLQDQPVARSGTIDFMLFCATCWSKTTRLLKTPIIGIPAVIVDSSWIDIEAGLAKSSICRMPPCFCAATGAAAARQLSPTNPATQRWKRETTVSLPDPVFPGSRDFDGIVPPNRRVQQ